MSGLTPRRIAALGVLILVAGTLLGFGAATTITALRDDDADPAAVDDTEPAAPPTTTVPLELGPGRSEFAVGRSVGDGALVVTFGRGVFDETQQIVWVGARVTNRSSTWLSSNLGSVEIDTGDGDVHSASQATSDSVPPGFSTDVTLEFSGVDTFDPDSATITVGADTQNQSEVPVGGGEADPTDANLPIDVPLDLWVSQGKYTWHVTSGRLTGGSPARGFANEPGMATLTLTYDWWNTARDTFAGYYGKEHLRLVLPDGSTVKPTDTTNDGVGPYSYTAWTGATAEFVVPIDAAGTYELVVNGRSLALGSVTDEEMIFERTTFEIPEGLSPVEPDSDDLAVPTLRPYQPPPASDGTPGTTTTTEPAEPAERTFEDPTTTLPGWAVAVHGIEVDPVEGSATIDATITAATRPSTGVAGADGDDGAFGGGDATRTFDASVALVSSGVVLTGSFDGERTVDEGDTEDVAFTFSTSGRQLALDDLTLVFGLGSTVAPARPIVLPLTPASPFPAWPPAPRTAEPSVDPLVAGDITLMVTGVSVSAAGFEQQPPAGLVAIQITYDATLGGTDISSFVGKGNVFLRRPDGYLVQAVAEAGDLVLSGQTASFSLVFFVPEPVPASTTLLLRSADEVGDFFENDGTWIEATAPLDLPTDPTSTTTAAPDI